MRNPNSSHPYRIPVVLALMAIAAILAFTTVMTVSAQSNDRDWKQSPTGLNVTAGDAAGELNIAWDAHPQTTKTLSDYRVTWTPDGENFRPNSETEWYAYPTTNQVSVTGLDAGETYKVRVRARYDDNKKSRWSDVVSGQAGVSQNSPAAGQPTIAGTIEVGETLTAATSAISDSNGLTNAVFSHQWIRSTNGSDNEITDATGSTYVITNADIDKAIKVHISFTDDDGYSETLTSNATTSVPVPAPVIVPPEEPQIAQQAGDDGETLVLDTWSLIPSGLGVDDSFRLIFLSSTKRNATSTSIGTYNTFVQRSPSCSRPRRHPGIQRRIHGSRLHRSQGRPRQYCDHLHQFRQRSPHLLAERQQGSRRIPGFLRWIVGRRSQRQERIRRQRPRHFQLEQLPLHRLRR